MLHRSVSMMGGGGASDSTKSVAFVENNENLIHLQQQQQHQTRFAQKPSGYVNDSAAKTPASKSSLGRRRALGDISNKKKNNRNGLGGKVGGLPNATNSILKQRSSNINLQPKSATKTSGDSLLPKPTGKNTLQQPPPRLIGLDSRNQPSKMIPRLTSHRETDNVLVSTESTSSQKLSIKQNSRLALAPLLTNHDGNTKPSNSNSLMEYKYQSEDPVPDIELPAGRTWKQQLEYDLKDEDDAVSLSSIEDILIEKLDSRNMWDDWKDSMLKQQRETEEIEAKMDRDLMQKLLEEDGSDHGQGLESLCDLVDVLAILGEQSEIDLEIKDDGDGWSLPASSLCDLGMSDDSFY